jgi:hypothetical protein
LILLGNFAADDLAVERQRLQHDVEAFAVLVREREADIVSISAEAGPGISVQSRPTPAVE